MEVKKSPSGRRRAFTEQGAQPDGRVRRKMDQAGIKRSLLAVQAGDMRVKYSVAVSYGSVASYCERSSIVCTESLASTSPATCRALAFDAALREYGFVRAHLYAHCYELLRDHAHHPSVGRRVALDGVAIAVPDIQLNPSTGRSRTSSTSRGGSGQGALQDRLAGHRPTARDARDRRAGVATQANRERSSSRERARTLRVPANAGAGPRQREGRGVATRRHSELCSLPGTLQPSRDRGSAPPSLAWAG
jgi:hypothetical protein